MFALASTLCTFLRLHKTFSITILEYMENSILIILALAVVVVSKPELFFIHRMTGFSVQHDGSLRCILIFIMTLLEIALSI